ncbi:MAG: hypothetical protein ABIK09_19510 [Pseudomonadota bacterium]
MRTLINLLLVAALASACVSLRTPDGYAEKKRTGRYDYLAVSTDASLLSLRVQPNEDRHKGTLAYWSEASRKQLTLSRGYELKEEGTFSTSKGPGRWFLFTKQWKGADHLYLLGLVVKGRKIYVMEGGGEDKLFASDVPRLVETFGTLH